MVNKYITEEDLANTMNLAKARAFHFQQQGWTMFSKDELTSAAYEGIAEACVRFDPSKGTVKDTKFSSYAYFWIDKYIQEYIRNNRSMLNGTTAEKWFGDVPYVGSIDLLNRKDNDFMSSDHQIWMQSELTADGQVEQTEKQKAASALLQNLMKCLDPIERTIMQLHIGMGVVNNEQLDIAAIAKAMRMTKLEVQEHMNSAFAKIKQKRKTYEQFVEEHV